MENASKSDEAWLRSHLVVRSWMNSSFGDEKRARDWRGGGAYKDG